jgi:tRNA nucleotidyltransferase/poly(A) polymerase
VTGLRPTAPPAVRWITRTLEDAGYETWAVGGAIRDAYLGLATRDWDLATRATPVQVRKAFRRTVPIGIEHGTVGVLARDGTLYEVTTFRRDIETDGRHAVVEFADSIEEDLARRDFTINAIAWHPIREEAHDPFDGVADLERGVLRTVGAPEERFTEDYLRILRALRFAGRFDLEIEEKTWASIVALVGHLPTLSAERVRDELLKVLEDDMRPVRALELYGQSGALGELYSELEELRSGEDGVEPVWPVVLRAVESLPKSRGHLRLAALLRPLTAESAAALLSRLRLSNTLCDEIARLAKAKSMPASAADDGEVRRWLSQHHAVQLPSVARVELAHARARRDSGGADTCAEVVDSWRRVREVRRTNPPLTVDQLALDGRGLIGLGLRPGPEFGRILESLLEWVLEDPTRNERARLEKRVLAIGSEGEDGG